MPCRAEVLYRFTFPVGTNPAALVRGTDGALYGVTRHGGAFGQGGVFRVAAGQAAQTVYSFGAQGGDGSRPATLIEDRRDRPAIQTMRLYGVTGGGGSYGQGTLFRLVITPAGVQETVLHHFVDKYGDGSNPASLMQASDNRLYGAAPRGGYFGHGLLFSAGAADTSYGVYGFSSLNGAEPTAAPTEDIDHHGTFYGVTPAGGKSGGGTVYKFTPSDGRLSTLHSFSAPDGVSPSASLVQGKTHELFFGATASDTGSGAGTLFRVSRTGQLVTTHFFDADHEGSTPAVLLRGTDGTVYGATAGGGAQAVSGRPGGNGTIFRADPDGSVVPLYSFPRTQGSNPASLLLSGGSLYGVAEGGGLYSAGVVFQFSPQSGALSTLHSFSAPDGAHPVGPLVQGTDGFLYGTASTDGTPPPDAAGVLRSGTGTLFRLELDADASTGFRVVTLHTFSALQNNNSTNSGGAFPQSALTEDKNNPGAFYGVTQYGGTHATGTVYRFVPGALEADSAADTLYSFGALTPNTYVNPEGAYPAARLLQQGTDFLGTALYGGSLGDGTVYRVRTDGTGTGTQVSAAHTFTFRDGAYPAAGLIAGPGGTLFGTTGGGGTGDYGTVFALSGSALTTLHAFSFTDGAAPQAALALAQDSAGRAILCGTTFYGGAGFGTTFQQVAAPGGDFNTLYSFTGGADGGNPQSALLVIPSAAPLTGGPIGIHIGGYRTAGAAFIGGGSGSGQAAKITPAGQFLTALRSPADRNGSPGVPETGAAAQAVTSGAAPPSGGTVFVQNSDGTDTRPVVHFGGQNGSNPAGALIKAADGYYYGTTEYGGAGAGTIYRIALPTIDDAAPKSPPAGKAFTLTVLQPSRNPGAERLQPRRIIGSKIERPSRHQRLIQHQLVDRIRRRPIQIAPQGCVQPHPSLHRRLPLRRNAAQDRKPRARVLPSLMVMRRRRQQRPRKPPLPLLVHRVEPGRRDRPLRRLAPHLVPRQQPAVTIESGVLDRLRRRRGRKLLELHHRPPPLLPPRPRRNLTQANPSHPPRHQLQQLPIGRPHRPPRPGHRPLHRLLVAVRYPSRPGVDAIGMEMRQQLDKRRPDTRQRVVARRQAAPRNPMQRRRHGSQLAAEALPQDLPPRRLRLLLERPRPPRDARPQRRQRRLAGRVVQHRAHIVHEIVTSRPVRHPIRRQPLMREQYLLDPKDRPPLPQPLRAFRA